MAVDGENVSVVQRNKEWLCEAANHCANTSPQLAAFYMTNVAELAHQKGNISVSERNVCRRCGMLFRPGNYSVRLVPRMKLTKRLSRLFQQQMKNTKKLGKYQQKLLHLYQTGHNRLVYKCLTCGERIITQAQTREQRVKSIWKKTQVQVSGTCQEKPLSKNAKKRLKKKAKQKQNSVNECSLSLQTQMNDSVEVTSATRSADVRTSSINLTPSHPIMSSTPKSAITHNSFTGIVTPSSNNKTLQGSLSVRKHNVTMTPGSASSLSMIGSSGRQKTPPSLPLTDSGRKKSGKKWTHQRLQEMLKHQKRTSESPKRSSLHDFLSSL